MRQGCSGRVGSSTLSQRGIAVYAGRGKARGPQPSTSSPRQRRRLMLPLYPPTAGMPGRCRMSHWIHNARRRLPQGMRWLARPTRPTRDATTVKGSDLTGMVRFMASTRRTRRRRTASRSRIRAKLLRKTRRRSTGGSGGNSGGGTMATVGGGATDARALLQEPRPFHTPRPRLRASSRGSRSGHRLRRLCMRA